MAQNSMGEELKRRCMEAVHQCLEDFLPVIEEDLQKIMDSTAYDFYTDYPAKWYGSERNFSLYDILETDLDESDMSLSGWFEPSRMTPYRSGYDGEDGLYNLVFREGYHGGAASGPDHPDEGTPYWRTPWPRYSRWGKPAVRAAMPPLKNFKKRLEEYESGEMVQKYETLLMRALNDVLG